MRTKRAKQYKKLVQQYQLHHGFREPYQVLVDADLVLDAQRFTMDLQAGLERTLHGKVKIMMTQCSIRHLYARSKEPGVARAIDFAKTFERRRCGHRPDEFEEALSTLDCLRHVVDEKGRGENKHRYVVASQDQSVRRYMRAVSGVPLIYINRSVMIMEPMSEMTAKVGASAERAKFRSELRKATGAKRKREDDKDDKDDKDGSDGGDGSDGSDDAGDGDDGDDAGDTGDAGDAGNGRKRAEARAEAKLEKKKKKGYGPKGPNPLSVKKRKTTTSSGASAAKPKTTAGGSGDGDGAPKKKRKRKHPAKAHEGGDDTGGAGGPPAAADEKQEGTEGGFVL